MVDPLAILSLISDLVKENAMLKAKIRDLNQENERKKAPDAGIQQTP